MQSVLLSPSFGHDHRYGRQTKVHAYPMPAEPAVFFGSQGHYQFPPPLQASPYVDPSFLGTVPIYSSAGTFPPHYVPGVPSVPSYTIDFEPASMPPQHPPSRIAHNSPEQHFQPQLRMDVLNIGGRDITPSPPSSSSSTPRSAVFSRRSDGFVAGATGRISNLAGSGGTDPAFCRISSPSVRQRTAQACENCRDRKTKCSGNRPTCKRCEDRGLTCEWAPETRVRGQQRFPKQGGGRLSPSDNEGSPVDALPHSFPSPAGTTQASPADGGLPFSTTSLAVTAPSRRRRGTHASLDIPHVKAITNAAAQRMSWPMIPSPASIAGIRKATSLELLAADFPATVGQDDDRWDCEWTESKPWEEGAAQVQEDTPAPIPARHFDFDAFIQCLDRNEGHSDQKNDDESPSAIAGSPILVAGSNDALDVEILNMLNFDSFGSSPTSSSWSSPISPTAQLDVPEDIAGGPKDDLAGLDMDLTPTIQSNEADIMTQYLNEDFFGSMGHH